MAKIKYDVLKERITKKVGIDEITLSITNDEFIVDDNKNTKCLLHIKKAKNIVYINLGTMESVGVTKQDLIDFNLIDENNEIITKKNNSYLDYNLVDTVAMADLSVIPDRGLMKNEFKPRKEIMKILVKLIEQFKNITHKDIKRIKTYEESLNKIKKEFEFSNEYLKTAFSLNLENCNGFEYLIIDIKRIILDGKPSTKFNLNLEEYNTIKNWLINNIKVK